MKIYGSHRDFYDSATYNFEVHYSRKPIGYPLFGSQYSLLSQNTKNMLQGAFESLPYIRVASVGSRYDLWNPPIECFFIVVGICGKLYCFVGCESLADKKFFFHNDIELFQKKIQEKYPKLEIDGGWFNRTRLTQELLDTWGRQYREHKLYDSIFIELQTPLFLIKRERILSQVKTLGSHHLVTNFNFLELGIQRFFDAYSLHQEIEIYLTNNMADTSSPDANFSDELKRDMHGFDAFSFKKAKTKK